MIKALVGMLVVVVGLLSVILLIVAERTDDRLVAAAEIVTVCTTLAHMYIFARIEAKVSFSERNRLEESKGTFDPDDFFEPRLCSSHCYQQVRRRTNATAFCKCGAKKYSDGANCCNMCSVQQNICAGCLKPTPAEDAFRSMFGALSTRTFFSNRERQRTSCVLFHFYSFRILLRN